MIQNFVQSGGIFLNQMIQGEPGAIIGPISHVLGNIINFIYILWSNITPVGALGVAIIIMTIIVRTALLPSSFKMIRNSMKMREMKPEMDKIKEKYGNTKDPELRRKMQAELQALNAKHGVNMLASCLPMLITWPLFMALFAVLSQAFLFVGSVGDAYSALSYSIINLGTDFLGDVIRPLAVPRNPQGFVVDLLLVEDMNKFVHVFSAEDWARIFSQVPVYADEAALANIRNLYDQKVVMMTFLGLNLVAPSGWYLPGVILPILSAATMLLSQYLMMKSNPPTDEQARNMQRMTMIIFPVMFGAFTIWAPAGVGVYWVMLNVYMIVQHYFIVRYYNKKDAKKAASKVS